MLAILRVLSIAPTILLFFLWGIALRGIALTPLLNT
jgi:hypothetical protein